MSNSTFNLPTPPGFCGFDPDRPVKVYERHLPHWRQDGATYFVTFRQADSVPQSKLDELRRLREEWERRHPPPRSETDVQELAKQIFVRMERWLDLGYGSCALRNPEVAEIVISTMNHFDGERYLLGSYVVMPNHVHVIVRPLNCESRDVEDVLQSWKGYTARRINERLRRQGRFWQEESYDRIIRDVEHLYQCIRYIGWNPSKAGIAVPIEPWIRDDWRAAGWEFEGLLERASSRALARTDLEVRPTKRGTV